MLYLNIAPLRPSHIHSPIFMLILSLQRTKNKRNNLKSQFVNNNFTISTYLIDARSH